jgi:DNA-binding CsgD family transcriptional regulator
LLSQKEVAVLLKISERAVREIERNAFAKIRNHPAMKQFWRDWQGGEIDEADLGSDGELSTSEIAAVYSLAQTPEERRVLSKVMALIASL